MAYTGTQAAVGTGSSLSVSTTSGGTYNAVGEVIGDLALEIKNMFEDATNMSSSGMECIAIFSDYPKLTLEVNRITGDTGQGTLRTSAQTQPPTKLWFKYQLDKMAGQSTAGDLYAFTAFIENFQEHTPVNKKATCRFDLKITNGITFTAGS